jgi:regulatory associated protein of mTOR
MTMTAVAVQQHGAHRQQYNPRQSPHSSNGPSPGQSRPQSYTSTASAQMRQEPAISTHLNGNGPTGVMNPRPAVSNDPVQVVNGNGLPASDVDRRPTASTVRSTNEPARDPRRASLQARPTSAPNAESSQDESEIDRTKKRPKSLLQRSKSDFGPRGEDRDSQEEEIPDWGARHGFEDHYASEEYVSQLANVSCTFLSDLTKLYALFQPKNFVPAQPVIAQVWHDSFGYCICIHIKLLVPISS